jgi:hypothetical protein
MNGLQWDCRRGCWSCGRLVEIQTVGDRMKDVVGLQPNSSRQRFLVMAKGEGCNGLLRSRA